MNYEEVEYLITNFGKTLLETNDNWDFIELTETEDAYGINIGVYDPQLAFESFEKHHFAEKNCLKGLYRGCFKD